MSNKQTVRSFYIFISIFTLVVNTANAQRFQWQAALPVTPDSGFYKILPTSEFIAKSHGTDLRDIRIYDEGNVVSYILSKDSAEAPVPRPAITRVKEAPAGYSVWQVQFAGEYLLTKLTFEVATRGYYFRSAYVTTDWTRDLDGDFTSRENKFRFSTDSANSIKLRPSVKAATVFVVVLDDDNQPLELKVCTAWQDNYLLIAWLEKGKRYVLRTGDAELTAPKYDLSHFAGKVPPSPPVLVAGNITADPSVIPAQSTPATIDKSTLFKNKGWIWASLIAITTLILLLTMRLLKDMQKKK